MQLRTKEIKTLADIKKMRTTDFSKAAKINADIIVIFAGKELFFSYKDVQEMVQKTGKIYGNELFSMCQKYGHLSFTEHRTQIIQNTDIMCFL